MRIVLVVPAFPKLSETFIVSKFLGLLEKGWDAHILCQHSEHSEWAYFPELQQSPDVKSRVHVTWTASRVPPLRFLGLMKWRVARFWQYSRRGTRDSLLSLLKEMCIDADLVALQPDIVHFEFGSLAVERMHLKNRLGCKVTASFRGYDINYVGLEQPGYYQPVWDHADGLHFLGDDLWQRARGRGCPALIKHALIPPAIDTSFFFPNGSDTLAQVPGPLRIVSVGRLEWKKGYEYALQAVQQLCQEGVECRYHIIGEGSYLEPIAFLRYEFGLEQVVTLLGARTRDQVRAEMEWADVFLHAAVSEGFCNAVMEAQAMQLPVVCSDADGLRENVADGVTGFVVPRRDPMALAGRLQRLAGDPALRQHMGRAGRQRVLERFQLSEQIAAFDRFYREIYDAH